MVRKGKKYMYITNKTRKITSKKTPVLCIRIILFLPFSWTSLGYTCRFI